MKPLAITMGDAAGVGPEIIADAWDEIQRITKGNAVIYGNETVIRRAAKRPLPVVSCGDNSVTAVPAGVVDARCGEAAYQAVIKAVDDAKSGAVSAVVTAPISKEALHRAGHLYPGHTEILAERCGVNDFAMMLYLDPLAVVHVTLHCAMRTIFEQITVESVIKKIRLADTFMRKIGVSARIGVCSLNPHAGENGLFGTEEINVLLPAVEKAKQEGIHADGPKPADTIMIDARDGQYNAVIAMFHDQGHIAVKLLGMHRAVNVTLGLPMIRTSVAHGTAFDKAGRGVAESGSLIEAVKVAVKLAQPLAE